MNNNPERSLSKVPEITLTFWIIKIAVTTLGETGGDAVSMSMDLGYLVGTGIFAAIFLLAAGAQIKAKRFNPFLYWGTIIATTTVGTTLADFADRSLGIGYLDRNSTTKDIAWRQATYRHFLHAVQFQGVVNPQSVRHRRCFFLHPPYLFEPSVRVPSLWAMVYEF